MEAREIDETIHSREEAKYSHTFHGRDLFAYAGAQLASHKISIEDVGLEFDTGDIVEVEIGKITKTENSVKGNIDILDVRFGSLWTNITMKDFLSLGFEYGDMVEVVIKNGSTLVYNNRIRYGKSFADVYVSEQIIYVNSLFRMAVAINQGNFAKAYSIGTGLQWTIEFKRI